MSTLEKSPYIASGDCINIDWVLCEVELMSFRCMRAGFLTNAEIAPTLLKRISEERPKERPKYHTSSEDTAPDHIGHASETKTAVDQERGEVVATQSNTSFSITASCS